MSRVPSPWILSAPLALALLAPARSAWASPIAAPKGAPKPEAREQRKLPEGQKDLRPDWLSTLFGGLAGVGGTAASWWLARRARHGELDKVVHQQRIETYPDLVRAGRPLALFFPQAGDALLRRALNAKDCRAVGQAMSEWYFSHGGLLLSVQARDAYFRLMRALTLASLAKQPLLSPKFPDDAALISAELVDKYRQELEAQYDLDAVDAWSFGVHRSSEASAAQRFQDYLFLQRLLSKLRTSLADDLRSRRGPS